MLTKQTFDNGSVDVSIEQTSLLSWLDGPSNVHHSLCIRRMLSTLDIASTNCRDVIVEMQLQNLKCRDINIMKQPSTCHSHTLRIRSSQNEVYIATVTPFNLNSFMNNSGLALLFIPRALEFAQGYLKLGFHMNAILNSWYTFINTYSVNIYWVCYKKVTHILTCSLGLSRGLNKN